MFSIATKALVFSVALYLPLQAENNALSAQSPTANGASITASNGVLADALTVAANEGDRASNVDREGNHTLNESDLASSGEAAKLDDILVTDERGGGGISLRLQVL
ncbi:MAG: hypothetical protein LBE89_01135 [Helicobacteraceae bacterium]|jgi:hypothetical protein|nr:hypothetical protein [Helicobacteraceae bacterium]